MQYKVCCRCGAHLDFGEICDCRETEKEAAPGATGTTSGNDYPIPVYQAQPRKSREVRPWLRN